MDNYRIIKVLGDGAFGSVVQAQYIETSEMVAVKKMKKKYYSWEECIGLRELKSLTKLNHPNITKLKEVVRDNNILHFVFEFMEGSLHDVIQSFAQRGERIAEPMICHITHQCLLGLGYMHKHGFFHRDLKPENLLCQGVTQEGVEVVKLADFGLAREIRSRPPFTDYISTRWYRAPELLLRSTCYSSPIDVWAMGCILAELYTLQALFPGNNQIDQLFKVVNILGCPIYSDWPEGFQLASAIAYKFPNCNRVHFRTLLQSASADCIGLLHDMLMWNPMKRPTANQALRYHYFASLPRPTITHSNISQAATPINSRPGTSGENYMSGGLQNTTDTATAGMLVVGPDGNLAIPGGMQAISAQNSRTTICAPEPQQQQQPYDRLPAPEADDQKDTSIDELLSHLHISPHGAPAAQPRSMSDLSNPRLTIASKLELEQEKSRSKSLDDEIIVSGHTSSNNTTDNSVDGILAALEAVATPQMPKDSQQKQQNKSPSDRRESHVVFTARDSDTTDADDANPYMSGNSHKPTINESSRNIGSVGSLSDIFRALHDDTDAVSDTGEPVSPRQKRPVAHTAKSPRGRGGHLPVRRRSRPNDDEQQHSPKTGKHISRTKKSGAAWT